MVREIEAKTILGTVKQGEFNIFGLKYNMNLYRGCQHACIYCDSRSKCYQLGDLSDIRVKQNALELLEKELKSKRTKGTIGFGAMNDPYMPVEKTCLFTKRALEIIVNIKYPVHIITKSNLVVRDIDLLKEISKTYAAISLTITTFDDVLCSKVEPFAPVSSVRFEALKKLSEAGIYCGVCLMPVLPYINDTLDNIRNIVVKAKESGASYILGFMGMTLREGQREHYYKELDKKFPGLKEKYITTYGERYSAEVPNFRELQSVFYSTCKKVGINTSMDFYKPKKTEQLQINF